MVQTCGGRYSVYFSTEFSTIGFFWGMRNITDLKMHLVKTLFAVGVAAFAHLVNTSLEQVRLQS